MKSETDILIGTSAKTLAAPLQLDYIGEVFRICWLALASLSRSGGLQIFSYLYGRNLTDFHSKCKQRKVPFHSIWHKIAQAISDREGKLQLFQLSLWGNKREPSSYCWHLIGKRIHKVKSKIEIKARFLSHRTSILLNYSCLFSRSWAWKDVKANNNNERFTSSSPPPFQSLAHPSLMGAPFELHSGHVVLVSKQADLN